jgi:predicted transcriptional regulator
VKEWVRMPSYWLRNEESLPLPAMRWYGSQKADQIAALMLYVVLVHHANDKTSAVRSEIGICDLTYTQLSDITGLSRAKVAGGLRVLLEIGVIESVGLGRNNVYKIKDFENRSGWAKLPAKGLYSKDFSKIEAFQTFHLRSKNELNALKIYLAVVALRTDSTNYAKVGYEKLSDYTGIHRNELKSAISLLINLGLLQVDSGVSDINEFATVNMYRPCHLEAYKHRGTVGRKLDETR